LTGRFIHITDFHPDPHYITGGTFSSGCHQKPKKKKGKGKLGGDVRSDFDEMKNDKADLAGPWGSGVSYVTLVALQRTALTSLSDCDSPMSLVNMTFDWLKKEWADEVDFVVWTGDNARSVDASDPIRRLQLMTQT
jgi:endopolyphosphatase